LRREHTGNCMARDPGLKPILLWGECFRGAKAPLPPG
jgi:hypothetical protein